MHNIRYEIGLNEQGRPYIGLPDDYEQRPEDRFFALEITRYILGDLLVRRSAELDEETTDNMIQAEALLGQLGDNVAEILYGMMKSQGEALILLEPSYHVLVKTIEERDALPETDIVFQDMIFDRIEGLKVAVQTYDDFEFTPVIEIFELVDGITNEHWVKL